MKTISIKSLLRALSATVALLILAPQASAQITPNDSLLFYSKSGKIVSYAITDIDSISFKKPLRTLPESVVAVDLGLSVKWANMNVGAQRAEDFGGFYAWGETEEKEEYNMENYAFTDPNIVNACLSIGEDIKSTKYDVAHMTWGSGWRMPSASECEELVNKCTWTLTNRNGVNGYKVTGPNGNSIFLPTGGFKSFSEHKYVGEYGYYWTSTYTYPKNITWTSLARIIFFRDGEIRVANEGRDLGCCIRPICP